MSPFNDKAIGDLKVLKAKDRRCRWFGVDYVDMEFDHFERPIN